MSYYIQESEPSRTGTYPEITDLFPDGVQTKDELVSWLDDGFKTCKEEGIEVKWVSYFTGYNAGAGTVYALSTDYANQIGYNGPTTAKTGNFILVMGKYLDQNLRELTVKGTKKMVKTFTEQVAKQRSKNKGIAKDDEEYPPYIRDYETLKAKIMPYLSRYDDNEFLRCIFSALAIDSMEYKKLWDEFTQ